MEIQKHINQALQQHEWKPCATGSEELAKAVEGAKIAVCNDDEIGFALKYAMALTGIRANNMPNSDEKALLFMFLRRNFGGHTPNELKLAFEMAASGRLEVDARHFENFSCEYVGRILTAFRSWAKQMYVPKKEEVKELPAVQTDWGKVWEDYKERAKTQDIDSMVIIGPVIDWLDENDYFSHITIGKEAKLISKARIDLMNDLRPFQRLTEEQVYAHARVLAAKNLLKEK